MRLVSRSRAPIPSACEESATSASSSRRSRENTFERLAGQHVWDIFATDIYLIRLCKTRLGSFVWTKINCCRDVIYHRCHSQMTSVANVMIKRWRWFDFGRRGGRYDKIANTRLSLSRIRDRSARLFVLHSHLSRRFRNATRRNAATRCKESRG